MKLALDTSAYIRLRAGHNQAHGLVRRAERIYFSSIVLGELLYGFRNGSRFEENHARLEAFLATPQVELMVVDRDTADRYARIHLELRRAGTPIPSNDLWIAAHVMQASAELVTFDYHFERVPGLAVSVLVA